MRRLFQHHDALQVNHAKSILEAEGIPCFVQNDLSHNMMGGSLVGPLKIFDPELCIVNDDDYAQALTLLEEWQAGTHDVSGQPEWKCPSCQEMVPGNMTECWNCQTARTSS